jgi:hypothetical protein
MPSHSGVVNATCRPDEAGSPSLQRQTEDVPCTWTFGRYRVQRNAAPKAECAVGGVEISTATTVCAPCSAISRARTPDSYPAVGTTHRGDLAIGGAGRLAEAAPVLFDGQPPQRALMFVCPDLMQDSKVLRYLGRR